MMPRPCPRQLAIAGLLLSLAACGTAIPDDSVAGAGFRSAEEFAAARGAPGRTPAPQTVRPPGADAAGAAQDGETGQGTPLPRAIFDAVEDPGETAGAEGDVALGPDGFPDLTAPPGEDALFQPAPLEREIAGALDGGADARQVAAAVGIEVGGAAPGTRPSATAVVDYALAADWPVGERRFSRSLFGRGQAPENCAAFSTDDRAQEAFLNAGGPDQDPLRIDPDGDGYACGWTPALLRRLADRARE